MPNPRYALVPETILSGSAQRPLTRNSPAARTRARFADRLNWVRAAVLGANDGIVSTAGVIFGVAGAAADSDAILVAGSAAVAAGAMSMAAAEYVSVSSQRDYQLAEINAQKEHIAGDAEGALAELAELVAERGLDDELARRVAERLTKNDPVEAHTRLALGFEPTQIINPWHAVVASFIAFVLGGMVPLAPVLLTDREIEIPATAAAAIFGLILTGSSSAYLGHASMIKAAARTVAGGVLAMAVTFGVGSLVGSLRTK